MHTPYTYLLGWSSLDRWYYGVRWAKDCHPSELWKSYKTSSKHVHQFAEKNGDPDVIEIRRTFSFSRKARDWEHKVLRRLDVLNNERWLNKTDNSFPFTNDRSYQHTPEFGRSISEAKKGKPLTERQRIAVSKAQREYWGSVHSSEGRRRTENMRARAKEAHRNTRWINNGSRSKHLKIGEELPEGWKFGFLAGGRKKAVTPF